MPVHPTSRAPPGRCRTSDNTTHPLTKESDDPETACGTPPALNVHEHSLPPEQSSW